MKDFSMMTEKQLMEVDLSLLSEAELMNYGIKMNWSRTKIEEAVNLLRLQSNLSDNSDKLATSLAEADAVIAEYETREKKKKGFFARLFS